MLYLYVYNLPGFELSVIFRPLVLTLAGLVVTLQFLTRFFGNRKKAALVMSFGLMFLCSFGYLYDIASLQGYDLMTGGLGPDEIRVFGSYFLFLFAGLWFLAKRRQMFAWTYFMNVFAFFAVAMPVVTILVVRYEDSKVSRPADEDLFDLEQTVRSHIPAKPDIYFIVLDGYARADTLRDSLGHENSAFMERLNKKGFWLSETSAANYSLTALSIAATLNYRYLSELSERKRFIARDTRDVRRLLRNNRTLRFLKELDYSIVAFESQYHNLHFQAPDVLFGRWWFVNGFEIGLMQRTPFTWLLRKAGVRVIQDWHRAMARFTLENLPKAVSLESPKFVFAHILPPHPPFLFGPDGEEVNPHRRYDWSDGLAYLKAAGATPAAYGRGYVGQVEFVTKKVEAIVDEILRTSTSEPIIILQSDHGPALGLAGTGISEQESARLRLGILNTAYLPNGGKAAFYEGMSPVNTFRAIFNHYFGTSYEMLEDRHFLSTPGAPYDLIPVMIDGRE